MDAVSLKKRLQQQYLIILSCVFLLLSTAALYFDSSQAEARAKLQLNLSHQAVEQAFNTYLTRAEYEVNFIAQDISLRSKHNLGTLERLFRNHDILFLGGLDFFSIIWQDGSQAIDPRSRLYTRASLDNLTQGAKIDQWSSVQTADNASLLVFKKQLVSEQKEVLGTLFGYVSLNENLTLASELIGNANTDGLRILNSPSDSQAILEEYAGDFDIDSLAFRSIQPLGVDADIAIFLEVGQSREKDLSNFSDVLVLLLSGLFLLVLLYFSANKYIEIKVLQPLSALRAGGRNPIPFVELGPLQQQYLVHQKRLEADKRRFQALLELNNRAVIFCSEIAEVTILNKESKRLFPGYQRAKTIFDFFPADGHQAIREVLKGIPQVSFQLRIEETDLLYEWQVRPFINESSYRGVMLVGQDVTDKESLNWQLMQLSPESGYMQEKIESQSLLSEMSYLSALSAESNLVDLQGWIRLILSIFDDLNDGSEESRNVALGEVMSSEYVKIAQELTSTKQIFELDCATELGLQKVSCGLSLEILIRLLIMLSMTHEGRSKLKVGPLQQGVEFILDGVSLESRPLMEWVFKSTFRKA